MHKVMRLFAVLWLGATLLLIARFAALQSQENGPVWSNLE